MSEFKPGDRVFVIDPALAEIRAIFKRATGVETPNHHGTVDEVIDGCVFIVFDDGGCAPYPRHEVRHLEVT